MIQKVLKLTLVVCLFGIFGAYAQTTTVSGTITDAADGSALPGVNVVVKGTTTGASSDFDGNYTIEVSGSDVVLQFSFVGYADQEITVGSQTTINVAMQPSAESLDEVVVTALGVSREKKALGYSVSELSSDEFDKVKTTNIATSLSGKVAGVNITESGGLGSGSRIIIRGNNSITGDNQALIVVDGVPINADNTESGGSVYSSTVTGGGISDINPDDIETISVLKGPNASALYGSRAANGVVLITTKKGTQDKRLGVSLTSNLTAGNAMFLPDFQNVYGQGDQGAPFQDLNTMNSNSWGGVMDGSQHLYYTGEQRPYDANSSNVEDFFQTTFQAINTLSLTKGGEGYSTRFSYTNTNSNSILPGSHLISHNFNLRTTVDLNDKLSFDGKATYFKQELENRVNLGSEGVLAYVYGMPRSVRTKDLEVYQDPNPSNYDIAAGLNDYDVITAAGKGKSLGNPYWMQKHDVNDENRDRFLGFAKLNYEINDWLSVFARVGGDVTNVRSYSIQQAGHHFQRWGRLNFGTSRFTEFNADFLATMNKDLTDKLNLVAMVGGNISKRTSERMSVSGNQFKIPTRAFLSNTNVQESTHQPEAVKKVNSIYASASLSYDNFLYLDVTARNDWSSTLPEDNRSYFYPSASLSVLVDRFIDPDKEFLNMLKVRASWAQVGNDTGVYQIHQTFAVPAQGYLGLTTLGRQNVKFNENLKPENVTSTDFGIEFKAMNNRLWGDFSIYNIVTTDMIFDVPVAPATGYNYFRENVGEVKNNGLELTLGGTPVENEKFRWDVSMNFSKNKNKLVELIDGLDGFTLNTTNSGNVAITATVGGSIGDIYGTTFKTDDQGNVLVNDEGRPLASDQKVYLGNSQPDFMAGITNNFSFGNFNLSFLIDGRFGGEIYSATSSSLDGSGVSERSLAYRETGIVVDGVYESSGQPNTTSITGQQYWQGVSGIADPYVYDQTNVRLRELSMTYSLPSELAGKIGMNAASISLVGRNLFFFYKDADDIDPDATLGTALAGQGISLNNVPTVRSMGLNINLKF